MSLTENGNTIATPAAATRKMVHSQVSWLKHKRQLMTILTLLFVCAIGWGIVSLFASNQQSKVDKKLLDLSKPLAPSLDLATLDLLENKRSFSDEELARFTIYRRFVDPRSREESIIPIDQPLPTVAPRVTTPSPTTPPTQQSL